MLDKLESATNIAQKITSPNFTKRSNSNGGYSIIGGRNESVLKSVPAKIKKFRRKEFGLNHLLASQSESDFARLMPHSENILFSGGEYLYQSDEHNKYVYFPETAVISHLCTLADGKTVEIAMVGREGASGLCAVLGLQPSMHCAQITVAGSAIRIKTEILKREFERGGKLQTLLLNYINTHISQISQGIVCKSFHFIEERLCSWLLMLHDRAQSSQWQMTHEQISLFLGVNRPTLTHAAKHLREKGFIDYSRGKFLILNRQGLEFGACECYSAVQNIH